MEVKHLQVSDSLDGIARIGAVFLKQVTNGPVSSPLREQMDSLAEELAGTIGDKKLGEIESVRKIRTLYHAVGIDPTKDRPSSERLLRRVVRSKPLAKINKLVDAMNFVSLRLGIPMGVYDWDKIVPPVLVRIGQPGEGFTGISSGPPSSGGEPSQNSIQTHGKLVLVDGEGPFGNPSHDSGRTSVSLGTVRAVVIAWTPSDTTNRELETWMSEVAQTAEEFVDARVAESGIL